MTVVIRGLRWVSWNMHREQELFLARPVQIDGALAHIRLLRDVGDGDTFGAASDQQLTRGFEDTSGFGRAVFGQHGKVLSRHRRRYGGCFET